MSNHHNHPTHVHNFLNRHTAFATLLVIVGCFLAGYFVGKSSSYDDHGMWNDRNHMDKYDGYYKGGKNVDYEVR